MKEEKRKSAKRYLDDEISFKELKATIGTEDAEAIKASEEKLREGKDLAEALSQL